MFAYGFYMYVSMYTWVVDASSALRERTAVETGTARPASISLHKQRQVVEGNGEEQEVKRHSGEDMQCVYVM